MENKKIDLSGWRIKCPKSYNKAAKKGWLHIIYEKYGYETIAKPGERAEQIIDFFKENDKWPSSISKNKIEKKLGIAMSNLLNKNGDSYNPEFEKRIRDLGWLSLKEKTEQTIDQIIDFFKENDKWPRQGSKNEIEKKLGKTMSNLLSKNQHSYNLEFEKRIRDMGWLSLKEKSEQIIEQIIDFFKENDKWPSTKSKNEIEKKLGQTMSNLLKKNGDRYNPEFEKRIRDLGWLPRKEKKLIKN